MLVGSTVLEITCGVLLVVVLLHGLLPACLLKAACLLTFVLVVVYCSAGLL